MWNQLLRYRLRVVLSPPLSSFSFSASGAEETGSGGASRIPKKVGSKTKGRGGLANVSSSPSKFLSKR